MERKEEELSVKNRNRNKEKENTPEDEDREDTALVSRRFIEGGLTALR